MNAYLHTPFQFSGSTGYLRVWVNDGEEHYFLSLSEYERCHYYWRSLMEKSLEAFRKCNCGEILVHYDELVATPQQEFDRVSNPFSGKIVHYTHSVSFQNPELFSNPRREVNLANPLS